jgi:hypothetical protein
MSMAARTDTQSPALHVADSHDLIRVHGARCPEGRLSEVRIQDPAYRSAGATEVGRAHVRLLVTVTCKTMHAFEFLVGPYAVAHLKL